MKGGREGGGVETGAKGSRWKGPGVSPNPSLFTFLLGPDSLCSHN